jgi:hypothetical protein
MPTDQVQCVCKCQACSEITKFTLPKSGFDAKKRGIPIAKAFSDSPDKLVVMLLRQVCPACQEKGH